MGSKSNDECLSKTEEKEYLIDIKGGSIVTTEAENRARLLQGKEC